MAERTGEGIAPGCRAVGKFATRLGDRGRFEIGAVQTASAHVDRFALPYGADASDAERGGDGGIDGRLDHGHVVAGHQGEDACRSGFRGVAEANRERSEHGDVSRRQDADAIAGHSDDRSGPDAAFARRRGDHDDGTFGGPRDGAGCECRSREAREERREGHCGDAYPGGHRSETLLQRYPRQAAGSYSLK
jgi:hypothetical protein